MEIRIATEQDIKWIADNLREIDRREIWASHRRKPSDLIESCHGKAALVAIGENPVCVFGCNALNGVGVPWLLATDELLSHKIEFLLKSKRICKQWLLQYGLLTNLVHADNDLCILWLQWLGFSFPAITMLHGEKFLRFEKRWQDV